MYYSFIAISAVLFSLQFFFNKIYQKNEGTDLYKAISFSFGTSIVICIIMLIINRFRIEFTVFSFFIALWYALNSMLFTYCSVNALSTANLSLFSMFSMLGGMLLPFIGGICFWGEPLTIQKVLCCVLIFAALLLCAQKSSQKTNALKYYIFVFALNGLAGVISKTHQTYTAINVSSTGFMFLGNFVVVILSAVILMMLKRKGKQSSFHRKKSSISCICVYGSINGIGNLLVLIALVHVPASIQYPMITGGVMVVSTIISFFTKERLNLKNIAAVFLAVIATLLLL